jgi:heme exporter protein A
VSALPPVELTGDAVAHRYGARVALQPRSFDVRGPLAVAVTGANGAGKSTLLRIVAGLLRPTRGRTVLRIGGVEVAPPQRRHHVGLATPELHFYEEMSAAENLVFAAEARGLASPTDAARRALDGTGLSSRAHDRVSAFSSGMKQRLRLAFAVLGDPSVLMLDEPGSHLDDEGRAAVEALVHRESERRLVLLATNDPREMALASQRIQLDGRGLGDPS